MSDKRQKVHEVREHTFDGNYPEVDTYPHVDTDLLYQGDSAPFHITLPIAQVGRVSGNGLLYDEELVSSIAEQLSTGIGGGRGHIKDEDVSTAFPLDEVNWIGHKQVGETLWAKGYIPPGPNRDDLRRKKATKGTVATSIYGDAIHEIAVVPSGTIVAESNKGKKTWRARNFDLEKLDLAPAKRASLRIPQNGMKVTSEMENSEEGEMPTPEGVAEMTVANVPPNVREQIIKQYETEGKVSRVAELEQQVKEMATYKTVYGEISSTLGKDVTPEKIAEIVKGYHTQMTQMAETLGVDSANVSVTVRQYHETVKELKQKDFTNSLTGKVTELTNWKNIRQDDQPKVAAFRNSLQSAIVAEMAGKQDAAAIPEAAIKVWEGGFKLVAETLVKALGGGSAIVGGQNNQTVSEMDKYRTEEGLKELNTAWGGN